MHSLIKTLVVFFFLNLASADVHALVTFDFEQKFFLEPGFEVKDHSLIKVGSTFHLFYLRGNPAIDIGHATSPDLIHWTLQPPILYVEEGTWDEKALWAPQVIFRTNSYFMFYTGVNNSYAQQTGLSYSTDLNNWGKILFPLYHPDPTWAEWSETVFSHGRDPYVFEHEGLNYMLVTAKTNTNLGAIASATSLDMINWTDNGPIYIHNSWHVLESVQLIIRNDRFNLFFTEEVVGGTSHMSSDDLYSGWDIGTRTMLDLGHAPEVSLIDDDYIFSRHAVYNDNQGSLTYVIVLDTLEWSGNLPYVYEPWMLSENWNNIWGNAFLFQPTFGNNPYSRGDPVDVGFEGNCWIGTYERYQGPLKNGTPGGYYGNSTTGVIRSNTFTITGNSMSLLVGGGDYPTLCYVALVDASTSEKIYSETGKNTDAMDRRYWNLINHKGKHVYIEIADISTSTFGHISCDEIRESMEILGDGDGSGRSGSKKKIWNMQRDLEDTESSVPLEPTLFHNTPNPFNPTTHISYLLTDECRVALDIFDVQGRRLRRLVDQRQPNGTYHVEWDGRDNRGETLSSGVYFYRLTVNGTAIDTRKMILLK